MTKLSFYLHIEVLAVTIVTILSIPGSHDVMAQNEVFTDYKDPGIIYNPANEGVYVIHDWQRSLNFINSSNQIEKTIFVGEEPIFMAYNPLNKNLYVTDHFDGIISVVNSSNNIIATIVPDEECAGDCWPEETAYNPDNKRLYVTLPFNDEIVLVNEYNRIIERVSTNTDPYRLLSSDHVAFDKNNNTYVTNSNFNAISVLNQTNEVVEELDVGHTQNLIMYVPFVKNMYVSLGDRFYKPNGTVSVINTSNHNITQLRFDKLLGEKYIEDMSYNPHNKQIYFAGSKYVYVINEANQVISTIPVGGGPCSITYSPANNNMYVGTKNSSVSVINEANQVISTIPVGGGPCSITYSPANNNIYTRNYGDATVSVINETDQVIDTITIPFLSPEKHP